MHFPANRLKNFLKIMYKMKPDRIIPRKLLVENAWQETKPFEEMPANLQGANVFIHQVKKVTIRYSSEGGGSEGTRSFLRKNFVGLAKRYSNVEFSVETSLRICNPVAYILYMNDREIAVPLRKLTADEVSEKVNNAMNEQGRLRLRFREASYSLMPAVRPVWSPFHGPSHGPDRILLQYIANKPGAYLPKTFTYNKEGRIYGPQKVRGVFNTRVKC